MAAAALSEAAQPLDPAMVDERGLAGESEGEALVKPLATDRYDPHRQRRGQVVLRGGVLALGLCAALCAAVGVAAPGRGQRLGSPPADDAVTSLAQAPEELPRIDLPPWDCAADGEDCSKSSCCGKPGSTCYRKNEYWAACNQTCSAGGAGEDAWKCEALGRKAPPSCSWEGENCATSGCCRRTGFKCFQRNEYWASCSDECSKLSALSPGEPWTCKELGGSQGEHPVRPVAKAEAAGTKLFCFAVVTPQGVVAPGVKAGYEKPLQDAVKAKGLGIFACDASAIYNGTRVEKGNWQSVVNTDIFIKVWGQVKADGQYAMYDWTVKVDADAVFFPGRLRAHLLGLRPPASKAVYLHNINFRFGFMGALEVLSTKAVDTFLASIYECSQNLGHNGGEDFFTMQCLDSNGVGSMTDNALLNDKYTQTSGWDLFDVDPCTEDSAVAFHPYKAINSWMACHAVAMHQAKPADFFGCAHKMLPDEPCSMSSQRAH